MIARRWKVWTDGDRADRLAGYLARTGMGDALSASGNLGALLTRGREVDNEVEFTLVTFWETLEAARSWAGKNPDHAVLYPEDESFFTRCEPAVEHLQIAELPAVG